MKKGSPDRVKEMLRIMNWLAAPFGSEEDRLLTFGLPNTDYTLDTNGNPTVTDQGTRETTYMLWKYTVQHPFVFFASDLPNFAQVMHDTEHLFMPSAVSDPTFGQVSTTNFAKGFTLGPGRERLRPDCQRLAEQQRRAGAPGVHGIHRVDQGAGSPATASAHPNAGGSALL